MISNQILQSNIDGLKEITRIDLCVCDVEGKVKAWCCPYEALQNRLPVLPAFPFRA